MYLGKNTRNGGSVIESWEKYLESFSCLRLAPLLLFLEMFSIFCLFIYLYVYAWVCICMYTCIHIHVYACIPSTTWISRIKIKLPGLVAEDLTLVFPALFAIWCFLEHLWGCWSVPHCSHGL